VPRADEQVRVVVVDDDERKVPLEVPIRRADGLDEVALVVPLDQVDDDLGVGLGAEDVAVGEERLLQPCVAQRVWPRPVVATEPLEPAASFRKARLPTART
jgi:hypothetical protein